MLRIVFLGTAASVPSRNRNLPAIYFEYDNDIRFLMDCGECCQKELMARNLKFMRINDVYITHWHADHFSGLMGLIQTMTLEGRKKVLNIYGPRRSKEFVDKLLSTGYYARRFKVEVHELRDGGVVDKGDYKIIAFEVDHRIPALGYVFQEKERLKANMEKAKKFGLRTGPLIGKLKRGEEITFRGQVIKPEDVIEKVKGIKVVYTGDTKYTENIIKYAKDADLLIAESTTFEKYEEEVEWYHMTMKDAIEIAKKANVKKLILTHISRRYGEEEIKKYLEKGRKEFKDLDIAHDGMEVKIKAHKAGD